MYIIGVQDSFCSVIEDVRDGKVDEESFWVSRRASEDSVQELYYVKVSTKEGGISFEAPSGVEFKDPATKKAHRYELHIAEDTYVIQGALSWHEFDTVVSLASTTTKLIMGTSDNALLVYDLKSKKVERKIEDAHKSDVSIIKVFPSQKVILTVGLDLQIKIWLLDGESTTPAQNLQGHKAEITAIEFLGNGRNFLSGSKDGAVNLWECGSGTLVYSFRRIDNLNDPVNCIATAQLPQPWSVTEPLTDNEYDTVGRELYVGYESGVIQSFDIGYHSQLRKQLVGFEGVPVTALATAGDYIVAGYGNGHVLVWEADTIKQDIELVDHSIDHLLFVGANGSDLQLVVGNGPDTTLLLTIGKDNYKVTYLAGTPELFSASSIACNTKVFVADRGVAVYGR